MTDDSILSLARLETGLLETTWRTLAGLAPKVRVAEHHIPSDQVSEALGPLLGQPAWLLSTFLEAVLSERGSFTTARSEPAPATEAHAPTPASPMPVQTQTVEYRIERHYGTTSPELVWSGDTGARTCARATRYVIDDLFSSARHSVFVAGYSFYSATELFLPLFRRATTLRDRGEPVPTVRVVLDCSARSHYELGDTREDTARRAAQQFLETCWKEATLEAQIQYYLPSTERRSSGFAPNSMHAKCIVVDGEKALVGSANFSTRGRDNRSLEVGALIRDYHFVQSLLAAWADVEADLVQLSGMAAGPSSV